MKNTKYTLLWLGGLFSIITVLTAFLLMQLQANVAHAAPTVRLYIAPSTSRVTQGHTANIQVRLAKNTADKVDYVSARISFPAHLLEVVSVSRHGSHFTYSNGPAVTYDNANGTIAISGSGNLLKTPEDVLVATIALKGEAVGSASIAFSGVSQAGDITNGGHVKNELDGMSNGSVAVVAPPVASSPTQPPASEPSSSDTNVSPPATTGITDEKEPTGHIQDEEQPGIAEAATDVTLSEESSYGQPAWMRYALYALAICGGLALIGFGGAWYIRTWHPGRDVNLPPIDPEQELGIVMPTTIETDAAEEEMDMTIAGETGESFLPIDDAIQEAAPVSTPNSMTPVFAAPEIVASPVLLEEIQPAPQADPQQSMTDPLTAALNTPIEPPQPVVLPAEEISSPPLQSSTIAAAEPTPAPVPISASVVLSEPVMPAPVVPQAVPAPDDYANLPDMFDIGEQRLAAAGYSSSKTVK